jgi:hypothetical protein
MVLKFSAAAFIALTVSWLAAGFSRGFPVYLPTFNKMIDSFAFIPTTNATRS